MSKKISFREMQKHKNTLEHYGIKCKLCNKELTPEEAKNKNKICRECDING